MEHKSNFSNSLVNFSMRQNSRRNSKKQQQDRKKKSNTLTEKLTPLNAIGHHFLWYFNFDTKWKSNAFSRSCAFLTLNYHARQFYEYCVSGLTMSPLSRWLLVWTAWTKRQVNIYTDKNRKKEGDRHKQTVRVNEVKDRDRHTHRGCMLYHALPMRLKIIIIQIICQIFVELLELWPIS